MAADPLSDVLRTVRLTGAVFFHVDAAAPWVAESPEGRLIARSVIRGAEHLVSYHIVTHGSCWAGLPGEPPVRLAAGDIIVFPQGDRHIVSSQPGMRADPRIAAYARPPDLQLPAVVHYGGPGPADVSLVCGFLGCDVRPFNPLLATLPRLIHVRASREPYAQWLRHLVHAAVAESVDKRYGGESVLARLSELMFVEVVRRHLESLPADQTGWLMGLRDPHIGRALGLLHDRPAYAWTLDELSKEAGLSRSALAERFAHLVGQPPMQYLTQWRMQVAAERLASGVSNVSETARHVGYESEAAFSRAFKKFVGVPPAMWRRQSLIRPPAQPSSGTTAIA